MEFFIGFKNKDREIEDIINLRNEISSYAKEIRQSDYFKEFYNNYLLIKGYTYRLKDDKQRLFYTFQEAVYALDLSKLTKDEEGIKLNSFIYMVIIEDCIKEYENIDLDEKEKENAILHYEKEQKKKSAEDSKYHMYQY